MKDIEVIEALFDYGNYWLEDETLEVYIMAANHVSKHYKTAFLFNKYVHEVICKKTKEELDIIRLMREKFPDSVALKIIDGYIKEHFKGLEMGSTCG